MGDVMREAFKRNWITTRDGNVAARIKNKKKIYFTPSGIDKKLITPDIIIGGKMLDDGGIDFFSSRNYEPTGEWEMHYLILKDAKTTLSSVHLHPPNIVAAMYAGWNLQEMVEPFPEVYRIRS